MKKLSILMAGLAFTATTAHADEGMWTLYNLPQAVYEQMQAEGFTLPYSSLYTGDNAIKNAVVNFSGYCSGVVVSPDGLVFTNHHCGFEGIRSHSTVEHDYMLNGFYAKSFEEELPNENMFVSFMKEQRDITDHMVSLGIHEKSGKEQEAMIDSVANAMTDSIKKIDPTLHITVEPFYEGNKYYATTYQDFTDLRLVFTVPKSMGNFGGETDNWMWPRQTCDFSVFRIYADPKTNGPAAYSKDNVPYHPRHWAPVSMEGYKDGDFSMTVGYPGSTERYLSSYGIEEMRDAQNAPRAQVRGVKQAVMLRHMRASEAVRIKYDSKYAQSSNYWKNSIGMNKCIDSVGIVKMKQAYEARIQQYQDSTGYLKGKLDIKHLGKLYAGRKEVMKDLLFFNETFRRTNELTTRALDVCMRLEKEGEKKGEKMLVLSSDNADTWDAALDREVMATLLKNYAEHVDKEALPAFFNDIQTKFGGDYQKYTDYLWNKSLLMKKVNKKGELWVANKKLANDPAVIYGKQLMAIRKQIVDKLQTTMDEIETQERYLCDAKIRMEQDMPHYSDANFTMRLSYGQVGGYDLGGKPSGYYTTAESIVEKMKRGKENFEYEAEPIMQELMSAKDFGRYTDRTTGKMQLCFLTNNDITGGNSGSPMFDGKGRLIGLAFDGNWDSLSSDIWFDSKLARCIGVDVRYMVYLMDKWGHTDRLLKEMGIE
ncbi:S46 family peptidase [Prevotella sp.]|uniref:S46 family peptidase n=1 Tax=Prevotella sp. TaxID=59823 RepID=UPI003080747C